MKQILLLSFVMIFISTGGVAAYKYLGVLHVPARSHYIIGSSLLKELARKGHEVYVISPFTENKPLENFHTIKVTHDFSTFESIIARLMNSSDNNFMENRMHIQTLGLNFTRNLFNDPNVQELMQSKHKFDAVICQIFFSEALLGFAEHFNAPLIGLSSFGAAAMNTDLVGSPSPPSYVPIALFNAGSRMTFFERLKNFAFSNFERLFMDLYYLPKQAAIYREVFPNNKRSLDEVRRNAALVLLNSHVSLSFARPYVPNMIEVGGMHVNRKANPLPAAIKKFIEESKNGVIYFSMGSNLKSSMLPPKKRQEVLKTLGSLKQRILWKFEDPKLEGKPDNVFISDWFPQDDILAHPNVIAFITHGGLLSTTESIYHGKPVIGIPVFADQFMNMARAESIGYGIEVNFATLTAEKLTAAIQRVINEPSFTQKVREISARYRDQPMEPLAKAVYWVEHVARHKGAKYMHCAGQDLNFIQYHSIDTMLVLYGGIVAVLLLVLCFLKFVLRRICGLFCKKDKKQDKKMKKN